MPSEPLQKCLYRHAVEYQYPINQGMSETVVGQVCDLPSHMANHRFALQPGCHQETLNKCHCQSFLKDVTRGDGG